jgi:hypothetical protein
VNKLVGLAFGERPTLWIEGHWNSVEWIEGRGFTERLESMETGLVNGLRNVVFGFSFLHLCGVELRKDGSHIYGLDCPGEGVEVLDLRVQDARVTFLLLLYSRILW